MFFNVQRGSPSFGSGHWRSMLIFNLSSIAAVISASLMPARRCASTTETAYQPTRSLRLSSGSAAAVQCLILRDVSAGQLDQHSQTSYLTIQHGAAGLNCAIEAMKIRSPLTTLHDYLQVRHPEAYPRGRRFSAFCTRLAFCTSYLGAAANWPIANQFHSYQLLIEHIPFPVLFS